MLSILRFKTGVIHCYNHPHLSYSGSAPTLSRNCELECSSHFFWSNIIRKTSSGAQVLMGDDVHDVVKLAQS